MIVLIASNSSVAMIKIGQLGAYSWIQDDFKHQLELKTEHCHQLKATSASKNQSIEYIRTIFGKF